MTAPGKHTPGPWRYPGDIEDELGFPCVVDDDRLVVASICDDGIDPARQDANARLIAAAPELLEALKDLCLKTVVGTDQERREALDAAWPAILKATGDTK